MPFSVTITSIFSGGVTSNTGFRTFILGYVLRYSSEQTSVASLSLL